VGRLLEGTKAERFQFIKDEHSYFGIRYLCERLNVTFQGYYQWKQRKQSARDRRNRHVLEKITAIYSEHRSNYGSPRIHAELKRRGENINHKRVARLMRDAGLVGKAGRIYRRKPLPDNPCIKVANRQRAEGPPIKSHQHWAGDVTYLKVNGQWRFLAVILDLHSRKVLGWSLSNKRNTQLTLTALEQASRRCKVSTVHLFHSDRGSEYGAYEYQPRLKSLGIKPSMNRPGSMNDNVYVETFFQTLKTECIKGFSIESDSELKEQLSWYLDRYYNQQRIHSALDFKTPDEYEKLGT
jgi:transposase InsO family protein